MASSDYYVNKVSGVDKAMEWLIKGANLGFYFGLFFAKHEVKRNDMGSLRYSGALSFFVIKNMLVAGGSLATLMFLVTALEKSRRVNDGLNYGIAAGITLTLWHKAWEIPRNHLGKYIILFSLGAGYFGNMLKYQE
ncbi:unnamed protein product [Blepharisma stoltei]|uniref:Uncharacterized protein n=1 Tax=Blepharisma stoltei TaxID=1481888 RepID=A0AAU9IRA0_9CILI|nr:unnamed protein product [Blepharisma stoltei]